MVVLGKILLGSLRMRIPVALGPVVLAVELVQVVVQAVAPVDSLVVLPWWAAVVLLRLWVPLVFRVDRNVLVALIAAPVIT